MFFNGVILTIMADEGPKVLFNLSQVTEITSMKIAISLMTALGLGDSQEQLNQLHGSFPVPDQRDLCLAYPFKVFAENSSDPRIQNFGRDSTVFLLFDRDKKKQVFKNYDLIERAIQRALKPVKYENNLSENLLKHIYNTIEKVLASSEDDLKVPTTTSTAEELKKFQKKRQYEEALNVIITELHTIESKIQIILDNLKVFSDPPIIEGAYYTRPKLFENDFNDFITSIKDYEKIINTLCEYGTEKAKDLVDITTVVRIGNFFYWKGLTGSADELNNALNFYIRANQLKDDSILWLTIGSLYNRLNKKEEAKDWISSGFKKMRERHESIRISRNMLFGDI